MHASGGDGDKAHSVTYRLPVTADDATCRKAPARVTCQSRSHTDRIWDRMREQDGDSAVAERMATAPRHACMWPTTDRGREAW